MADKTLNTKPSHLNYIDIYGNKLMIYRGKNQKINFTLYHQTINEGSARKEFEDVALKITPSAGEMFKVAEGLYEILGNKFVLSEDPIRDGQNYMFLEQENPDSYQLVFARDLANDLNLPHQTNVEISGASYSALYDELIKPDSSKLVKTKNSLQKLPQ